MNFDRQTYRLSDTRGLERRFLLIGILGLVFSLLGVIIDADRFFQSYLVAYCFWLSLALGALFFVMLHHLVGAVWSEVLRRLTETVMVVLPWMVIFFIPVALSMRSLFAWSRPEVLFHDAALQGKVGYLNTGFFLVRAAGYFFIWILLVRFLYSNSVQQDSGCDPKRIVRLRRVSALGMILFAFTCSFAAIDWLMALDPHWYSTIFGAYFFSGLVTAFLCFLTLVAIFLGNGGILIHEITVEHYHDLGKLVFAFMILWAYMAFSQYMLIWYSNIPEETLWFHHRWDGPWKPVSWLIPFTNFAVPFVLLMSRAAKRNLKALSFISVWLLIFHWLDVSWLVLPTFRQSTPIYSWMDIATTVGIGGLFLWLFWRKLATRAILPVGNPNLQASIRFVND